MRETKVRWALPGLVAAMAIAVIPVASAYEQYSTNQEDNCAACHGADGEGGAAPDLTVMVPILSDGELESIITNGSGYMAPIALDDDEVAAVIDYLRATFG